LRSKLIVPGHHAGLFEIAVDALATRLHGT
jgi:hypothetical protein